MEKESKGRVSLPIPPSKQTNKTDENMLAASLMLINKQVPTSFAAFVQIKSEVQNHFD